MSLLVRKIIISKWKKSPLQEHSDVNADAITGCLKTFDNTLSVWRVESEEDIETAVLAMIAGQSDLDKMDIVILSEESLANKELNLVTTDGRTPVESLRKDHRDIAGLTYTKLGAVKDLIVDELRAERNRFFTVQALVKILKKAIADGKLTPEKLEPKVQAWLNKTPNNTAAPKN